MPIRFIDPLRNKPRGEVHVVRQPKGVHPRLDKIPKNDPQDAIVFDDCDRDYYHVEKVLGAGAFGVAARVRVLKDDKASGHTFQKGEVVVVKQVRIDTEKAKRRLREEYEIAQRLGSHENIVEMYSLMRGCRDGKGHPCERMFMRFCNVGNLSTLMENHEKAKKWMPEPFIWYMLTCMGYALARMHTGLRRETLERSADWPGFVHYDIKPDNILLNWSDNPARVNNPFPTPKLADFGCAKKVGRTPDFVGHRLYMAPELVRDPWGPARPECDVFALGVLIYQMMEQHWPYPYVMGPRGEECDYRYMRDFKTGYHPRLMDIVERCLDPDYRRRPRAEEIFISCLRFKEDTYKMDWEPWGDKLQLLKPI